MVNLELWSWDFDYYLDDGCPNFFIISFCTLGAYLVALLGTYLASKFACDADDRERIKGYIPWVPVVVAVGFFGIWMIPAGISISRCHTWASA